MTLNREIKKALFEVDPDKNETHHKKRREDLAVRVHKERSPSHHKKRREDLVKRVVKERDPSNPPHHKLAPGKRVQNTLARSAVFSANPNKRETHHALDQSAKDKHSVARQVALGAVTTAGAWATSGGAACWSRGGACADPGDASDDEDDMLSYMATLEANSQPMQHNFYRSLPARGSQRNYSSSELFIMRGLAKKYGRNHIKIAEIFCRDDRRDAKTIAVYLKHIRTPKEEC